MSEPLFRLLYCSRSLLDPASAEADIRNILEVARRNNRAAGLSGALLFTTHAFAQVLEGPQHAVEATFERIQCDPRHRDSQVIEVGPIEAREFGAWSMAYSGTGDALAGLALDKAFALPPAEAGTRVLGILRDVMAREGEWA